MPDEEAKTPPALLCMCTGILSGNHQGQFEIRDAEERCGPPAELWGLRSVRPEAEVHPLYV